MLGKIYEFRRASSTSPKKNRRRRKKRRYWATIIDAVDSLFEEFGAVHGRQSFQIWHIHCVYNLHGRRYYKFYRENLN